VPPENGNYLPASTYEITLNGVLAFLYNPSKMPSLFIANRRSMRMPNLGVLLLMFFAAGSCYWSLTRNSLHQSYGRPTSET
jgi:hypothetical protein